MASRSRPLLASLEFGCQPGFNEDVATMEDSPSRALGYAEHDAGDDDGEDQLETDGRAPRCGPRHVGEAVVDPVRQHDADADEPDLPGDDAAAPFLAAQFALVHGHRARVDAGAEAGDDTADDQVGEGVGGGLQRGADDDQGHGAVHERSASGLRRHGLKSGEHTARSSSAGQRCRR